MESKYDVILQKVALKHKLPVTVIKKIVESQFEFINTTAKQMDFSTLTSKEEFNELKTNFTVKYLFTMFASYNMIERINNKRNEIKCQSNKEC